MPFSERFGFLNFPKPLFFKGGMIEPLDNFSKAQEYVDATTHQDGFCYPPLSKTVELDPKTMEPVKDIPNTERPARVFNMPMSHRIVIDDPVNGENLRNEDAALIVHLLAFLFGTRLQFSGWRFDGKVPIRSTMNIFLSDKAASGFVSYVYQKWKSWTEDQRKRFVNILFMKQKAHSCEWEWDAFLYQYMVLDAIYHLHVLLGNNAVRQSDRLRVMSEHYSIQYMEDRAKKIADLRNSFFHEALWDGATPGFGSSRSFHEQIWLGKLNARLIVAITGYQNEFSRSSWWTFGTNIFDKFESL